MALEDFREVQLQRRVRKLKQLLGISRAKTVQARKQNRRLAADLRRLKRQMDEMEERQKGGENQ